MTFGNQPLVKKMNELMLEYADDIVPIERDKVLRFFEQQGIPYREDYIDFLARFGGNQSVFFQDFNCTFQEITECYLEEPDYELPPKGYSVFSVHSADSFIFLELDAGKIFSTTFDRGTRVPENESYQDIDAFLWILLHSKYYHSFMVRSEKHSSSAIEIDNYFSKNYFNNGLVQINSLYNRKNYLKGNKLYFYYEDEDEYYVHTLSDEFVQKLYE